MGKKSRRQRVPNAASRRGPTPGRSDEPSTQPKLTVAEAEAECRAAIAAIPPKSDGQLEVSTDPRSMRAIEHLMDALTLDVDDQRNFQAYLRCSARSARGGGGLGTTQQLMKNMKRWPRIRKYWPRIRRRICWGCGKEYDLSEPRLWVCSSCGEARYCDEACQRAHWLDHRSQCFETLERRIKKRVSEGTPKPEVRREFRHLLDVFAMPRNM